jgi:transposase/site-specific recombinase XerD
MRYELSDYEWTAIKPMLPNKPRGVRRVNDRRVLNGIFWVLRSGAPWRDLPETYGPRTTCYNRFVRWRRAGVWDQIMEALAAGHDAAVQMIDTSVVRVHQHGACIADSNHQDMGRSRGGLTSKIHAVVDTNGLPVYLALTPGEAHDNRLCSVLLSALLPQTMLLAEPNYRITRADTLKLKRALQELPSNRTKRFPGLTAPQVIRDNKARATPFQPLDTKTINNTYLGGLRSLLNWCRDNDLIPDSPAEGISVDVVKDPTKRRVNFAPSDLIKIFSPKRYDTGKPFNEEQWAALISVFGGMRASELAQIKLDSIRHERGILVFAIEEKTKNLGSQRLVPVHSVLLGLGLQKCVDSLRASGATHLLPNWYQKGEAKRDWSAFIPDAFNVTTKKNLGITGRKTWHSFRHTFKSGLKMAGVPKSMRDDLAGHSDSSAGAGYEHGEAVEAMKESIEKLRFDGFTLGIGVAR